jgi:integrase/recombinase XerD
VLFARQMTDPMLSEQWLNDYLTWLRIEKGRSERTLESYERDLNRFVTHLNQSSLTIEAIQAVDLERYLAQLRQSGLAPSSVARHRSSIAGWFHFLVDERVLDRDPSLTIAAAKVPLRLPKALSEAVINELIDGISGSNPLSRRDRAIVELLYATGARVSEVCRLDLSDLNYDGGLLRLIGKGDKERLVPLGRSAQQALASWLEPHGRAQLISEAKRAGDPQAVFVNTRGARLTRQALHHLLVERGRLAGIEAGLSPHTLRHSCATHMLAHGADIRVVQELLGHASVTTTQIYTKVSIEQIQRAYDQAHPRARGRS